MADLQFEDFEINEKSSESNEVSVHIEPERSDASNDLDVDVENHKNKDGEDSDKDDDDVNADEIEVKNLESVLLQNPYDYATHVALISKLRSMGELERLRKARENMSEKYPLTSEFWLSWLRDEMNLAVNSEEKLLLVDLFKRAVKDYLSVEIWLEYLQFSIGNIDNSENTINSVRSLFEHALISVALHVTKGAIIWEAYREFENVLAEMESDETKKKNQINRVGQLFRRQLGVPLLDMEKTYQEFLSWKTDEGKECFIDDKLLDANYHHALNELNNRRSFEAQLISASHQSELELYQAYKTYIDYEKRHGDPTRVNILFERAVADLSLHEKLWLQYLDYLESTIKMEVILEVCYERATRNVPWCSEIWKKWIRSMEKWNKSLLDVQKIFENALSAGFSASDDYRNIWMVFLEYLRRKINLNSEQSDDISMETIRQCFNRACEHLAKLFGLHGDPQCIILQFWARTEAIIGNNMEKARGLWADILSQGHATSASSWLEYISLERCYGDIKHLRKLFPKALAAVKDWPESISNAWIDFERDKGTIEQMEICEAKIKERLLKTAEERQKSQKLLGQEIDIQSQKKAEKRKLPKEGKWKNLDVTMSKISRIEKQQVPNVSKDPVVENTISPTLGLKISAGNEKSIIDDEVDDKLTVFVSNLDYNATEEEICTAFQSVGPITKFKMVKDYKGRSKGFCYVQLSSPDNVEAALKLDRIPLSGRPMFISRCDPNKTTRGTGFKYACNLEKNKLFVKGLPVSITKEDLEGIFKVHGILKDVRLVTYRNGHSKGLAYVEFEDEISASRALIAADGMTISNKIISVAISKPPERKKAPEEIQIKCLGGSSVSRSYSGGPKTMLSMIPRNVKTNSKSDVSSSNVNVKLMSNQDFRNMLLKENKK